MTVLMLELNEVNFDHVRFYAERGDLPTLQQLVARHGLIETTSETSYEKLEPWIQWVTAHTGRDFCDHGVFRLGDIVNYEIPQIWEILERQGLSVGAISPMNANNRCRDAAFFVPDPWTPTSVTGSALMKKVYKAVAQAVNDNAQSKVTPESAVWLVAGLAAYARPANYARYAAMVAKAAKKPWIKAMVLDQLLADIFIGQVASKKPDFASLFLNAAAHIQHHYMFNSGAYSGPNTNPEWYLPKSFDPVLDIYQLYDRIISQVEARFPDARIMLVTGLHQDPYPTTFYWRLKEHAAFLKQAEVPFQRVEPRMSRDFIIYCADEAEAKLAERRLAAVRSLDGVPLFSVDNRGSDLFVMLTWPNDIPADFEYLIDNATVSGLHDQVAFVAIKNGEHNGVGYVLDTGEKLSGTVRQIPLREMPDRIAAACGVQWSPA